MDRPEDRLALIELLGRDGRVQRTVDVHRWPVTLGRALDNTVVLDDPHVAPRHATLQVDAQGGLALQAGPGLNGVLLRAAGGRGKPRSLAAGAACPVPAGGALLQVGAQRLRLRLAGEVLAPERLLPAAAPAGAVLVVVTLAWLTLQGVQGWVTTEPGADFTEWLPWLLGLPMALALWCGLWALGSKVYGHGFDFIGHAATAMPILLVLELLDLGLTALAAGSGWPLPWQWQKLLLPPLGLAWLLRAHLHQVLPQRRRAVNLTLGVLLAGALALQVAGNLRQHDQWVADPYMRTLPLPMLRWGTPRPTADLDQALLPLRERLADRVRQAGQDEPEDDKP